MASTSPTRSASGQVSDAKSLMRQNQELRDRLQEEASLYRRRLDTYKQAQQNQAALVGRLQSKVLQYKQKCNDLEGRMFDTGAPPKVCNIFTNQRQPLFAYKLTDINCISNR